VKTSNLPVLLRGAAVDANATFNGIVRILNIKMKIVSSLNESSSPAGTNAMKTIARNPNKMQMLLLILPMPEGSVPTKTDQTAT
jgi:hypothetical protein